MSVDPAAITALFADGLPPHRTALQRDLAILGACGIVGRRLEFFLAQIGHETAGLRVVEENLSYSAERLTAVWPRRFPDVRSALPFARAPERLAERVYGGRMGNDAEGSGDGWRYRGRGYLQLTGRDAYRAVGDLAGLDLEGDPGLAAAPGTALRVACACWRWKGLDPFCDADDFTGLSRRINGGTNGLADRRAWLARVRRTLGAVAAV
ncbi:MAG: glycoside hydrolase family 19 protein [Geminicoccaceae bacterium]